MSLILRSVLPNLNIGVYSFSSSSPVILDYLTPDIANAYLTGKIYAEGQRNYSFAEKAKVVESMPVFNSAYAAPKVSAIESVSIPNTTNYNSAIYSFALDGINMLEGTGIRSAYMSVATGYEVQSYLGAYSRILGQTYGTRSDDTLYYYVNASDTSDARIFFGVSFKENTLVSDYEVYLDISNGRTTANFELNYEDNAFTWNSLQKDTYIITDSTVDSENRTVQNTTRLSYLYGDSLISGTSNRYSAVMTMTHKASKEEVVNTIVFETP